MADQDGAPKPPVPTKEDLPQELQDRPQFVAWRYVERNGELTKVPYQTNGNWADTTATPTWTTLDEATRYVNANAPRVVVQNRMTSAL
jgi:primase-polymerase (primpol)-like protein